MLYELSNIFYTVLGKIINPRTIGVRGLSLGISSGHTVQVSYLETLV